MSDTIDLPEEDDETPTFREKVIQEAKEWGAVFAWFIPLYLLFTGCVYEQRVIPSESMVPNLQVGDRVAVNKFAYGYSRHSVPFSLGRYLPLPEGRIFASMPRRGDVVVFEHPHTPRVMIKRVIAVGGDQVEMRDEQIFLNGEAIKTVDTDRIRLVRHKTGELLPVRVREETLGDVSYTTHQFGRGSELDNAGPFLVPEGHIFFMGDNRDDSLDARNISGHCVAIDGVISAAGCEPQRDRRGIQVPGDKASIGFVPLKNVIGRADTVIFTTKRCKQQNGVACPPRRVWKGL